MTETTNYRIIEHQVPCSYLREYAGALAGNQEDTLHLAVKQYIPLNNPQPKPGDVTIIAAHANGFPKELYEPLWHDIIESSARYDFQVRSIWMADVAQQGQSGILNEQLLGNDPSWYDHPRDLMHLINVKRDEMPRPIVGIGHSMGGNNLVNMALWHPRLFTSLILLDPVVQVMGSPSSQPGQMSIPRASAFRRDVWANREEATKAYLRNPFYQTWDKRVLSRWMEYGFRDLPTTLYPQAQPSGQPMVTLSTTVANEVHTFLRPNYNGYGWHSGKMNRQTHADLDPEQTDAFPFYRPEGGRTRLRLPELRPSVLYIFGGKSNASTAQMNRAMLKITGTGISGSGGVQEGRVKGITFDDIGHLIPMEAATLTAIASVEWLSGNTGELARWKEESRKYEQSWSQLSLREKQQMDEHFKAALGGDYRQQKPSKI